MNRGFWTRRLVLCLMFFQFATTAHAGQATATDRIVAEEIRQLLEAWVTQPAPRIAGEPVFHVADVRDFYQQRQYQPAWTPADGHASKLAVLRESIHSSASHGFQPAKYHLDALNPAEPGNTASIGAAALDVLASDAFLQQAFHRSHGVVSPGKLDPLWDLSAAPLDALKMLNVVAGGSQTPREVLDALWPASPDYRALLDARARIQAGGELSSRPVSSGPALKPGQRHPRVLELKHRLLGPGMHDDQYDASLEAAVKAFQTAAGLDADGVTGAATLEELNATSVMWLNRIDANLERWRWLPRGVPDTYLRVNIAAYTLRMIRQGKTAQTMRIIAGRPVRRTPVFKEDMRYLVMNPYWNVPYKLAVEDKLPVLQKDPQELVALGFEVSHGGAEPYRPLMSVDWSQLNRRNFPYQLRQKPGPKNALGRVKFMLPNRHAVYLHDTPSRELFSRQERAFSSGCIRLAEPLALADWILQQDGQPMTPEQVQHIIDQGDTRTFHLRKPLPTYILYLTAFLDESEQVTYRRDVYQRDEAIVKALKH